MIEIDSGIGAVMAAFDTTKDGTKNRVLTAYENYKSIHTSTMSFYIHVLSYKYF